MRRPFRRTVVFESLGRRRLGEGSARLVLYPRRGLVSVLAGGVGYQKTGGRDEGKSSGPTTRKVGS